MIPIGTYLARGIPTATEWGEGGDGKEYLQVEYAFDEEPVIGQTIVKRFYFTDKAMEYSIDALRLSGCEFPEGDITNLEGFGAKQVRLVIEHKTYEGKTRSNVKYVNSTGPTVKNPLSSAGRASLKQRAKGVIISAKTPKTNAPQKSFDDTDIPF